MKNIKLFIGISFVLDFVALFLITTMFFVGYVYTGILHNIFEPVELFIETFGLTAETCLPFIFILNTLFAVWATILAFQQNQLKIRSIFALIVSLLFFLPAIYFILAWSSWSG